MTNGIKTNGPQVLVLGTADWNQPIATNQHYMVRELSRSFSAVFVESIGLRRPEIKYRDLLRIARRIFKRPDKGSPAARPVPSTVEIISPLIIPIHSTRFEALNRKLLQRGKVKRWTESKEKKIFWTYSPVTYGLENFADVAMYHCVDLLGEFPGIDRELIHYHERRLAAAGVRAAGSSEVVMEHLKRQGFKDPSFWPNVADTETILVNLGQTPDDLQSRRKSAIFAGNLTDKKVDFQLLRRLLDSGLELDLAGPVSQGGGNSEQQLSDLISAGARYHGMLSLEELSGLMGTCRVGIIPYEINSYTQGVSPLKVYEYMAAGLEVVSTRVPSVHPISHHISVADSHSEFIEAVDRGMTTPTPEILQKRRSIARENSWVGRGEVARELLKALVAGDENRRLQKLE